jgi:hypothetical protein
VNYEAPTARLDDIDGGEYRDPKSLAQWAIWVLYAQIAVALAAIFSGVIERQVLSGLQVGTFASGAAATSAAEASDTRQALVGGAQFIAFIISGVLCLRWIHRMAYNARIRARVMHFTPGWAVGWYFIPIAYWWKPFQAMKEIWDKSVEQAGAHGREAAGLLGAWWALWISESLLSNASFRMKLRAAGFDGLLAANFVTLLSDALEIPLCIVFILMVKRLTAMQDYAHENPQAVTQVPDLRGANW